MIENALADFTKTEICKKRQFAGLMRWAKPKMDEGLPTETPDKAWVQQRIIAERIPSQTDNFVLLTISYTLLYYGVAQDPIPHMNAYNSETTETALAAQVNAALLAYMPAFCASQVFQNQIDQWLVEHGFTVGAATAIFGGPPTYPPPLPPRPV